MEYISLSWSDIPELVVPIMISLIEGWCYQGSYWTKGSLWLCLSIHFEILRSPPWLGLPLRSICVTNDHGYRNHNRCVPYSWLITRCVARVTRRVPQLEQELLTLPEHLHHLSLKTESMLTNWIRTTWRRPKGYLDSIIRKLHNTMVHKTLHRKLKIKQHKSH